MGARERERHAMKVMRLDLNPNVAACNEHLDSAQQAIFVENLILCLL